MQPIIQQRARQTTAHLSDHPLLNRLYQSRGVKSPEELVHTFPALLTPNRLANIEPAVELLLGAFKHKNGLSLWAILMQMVQLAQHWRC